MPIRLGILGLGTVGGGLIKLLQQKGPHLKKLIGDEIEITKVCSRRDHRLEELGISKHTFTTSLNEFFDTPLDIIVELCGSNNICEFLLSSLDNQVKVVTANKSLLATKSKTLMGSKNGDLIFYEASCLGGIPIISSFEEALVSNQISSLFGIFNGTCNYILTQMAEHGQSFSQALSSAQEKGFAEADPTADIEGHDATQKLSLLASLAFGQAVEYESIPAQGISALEAEDFKWAANHRYCIKLISMGERSQDGKVFLGTFPTMIANNHPLANVNSAFNAIFVRGDAVGDLMFYGPGAGEFPTASAVLSDVIAAAQDKKRHYSHEVFSNQESSLENDPARVFPFYIRLKTHDQTGILAKLSHIFADHQISLKFVQQELTSPDGSAELVFMTHPCTTDNLNGSLDAFDKASLLVSKPLTMRILDL